MPRVNTKKGSLLVEILVAVSVFAAVALIGAQANLVSLESNKASGKKGAGVNLLSEMMQGVRGATEENWQNLYNLTKPSTHYYPALSGGKWILTEGDENVTVAETVFTRYFTVSNVSRDPGTRDIETAYNSAHDDPSTQQVIATVSSSATDPLSITEYFSRWRNKICVQTSWASGGSSGVKNCPDTTFVSQSNVTTGASLELCSGGC